MSNAAHTYVCKDIYIYIYGIFLKSVGMMLMQLVNMWDMPKIIYVKRPKHEMKIVYIFVGT